MIGSFLWILVGLPILVFQWVGVIGLSRPQRGAAWWLMLVGATLSAVGMVAQVVGMTILVGSLGGGGPQDYAIWVMISSGISSAGALAFMAGFAVHAWKSRRVWQRVEELEGVIAAQNEQLSRSGDV